MSTTSDRAEPFAARLQARAQATGSVVCLGLDPRPGAHPLTDPARLGDAALVARAVTDYFRAVLDATHDLVACCKPQAAFFEALGLPGLEALAALMAHSRGLGVPVVLDAKRGDIGSTAEAYAAAYLTDGAFAADALTVNPFLGLDTLEPFLAAAEAGGRGLFVLVRTSNPGSAALQEAELASGEALYQRLADALAERSRALAAGPGGYTVLGAVAGATAPAALAELRRRLPRSLLLVPGYGAQGGSADDVAAAFDAAGRGAVVNASRSLTYGAGALGARTFAEVGAAARAATLRMRDDLAAALQRRAASA
ncbi:MAG: orotidine-5'-phosphate decarboxylase [Deinococcales bacterium]|nr:orotidine-5'-phosphate decarboxylase [Deinococcales bacterium]